MALKRTVKGLLDRIILSLNYKQTGTVLRTTNYIRKVILSNAEQYYGKVHQCMDMNFIIPSEFVETQKTELGTKEYIGDYIRSNRIKVRIMYPSGTSWNSVGSLYHALEKDDRYDVIVLVENYPRYLQAVSTAKAKYVLLNHYDIRKDKPDLLLVTSYSYSPPEISFQECRKYIKKVISVFPNVVVNEPSEELHWKYVSNAYKFLKPDYYLFDRLLIKSAKKYISNERIIEIGNPQFDDLFAKLGEKKTVPESWRKLEGKKVFLWATDHGLTDDVRIEATSVDLYIAQLIYFFYSHADLGLIIRFHPYLIREMTQEGHFWSQDDFERFVAFCDNSPNIVWDTTTDYSIAFNSCDAMIVDVNCSFIISFLPTHKPICRLLRDDCEVHLIHPELTDAYYYARNMDECTTFINEILYENDRKKSDRDKALRDSMFNLDGNNGHRIKLFIDNVIFGDTN